MNNPYPEDSAEMRARGYCRSTLSLAEQAVARQQAAAALCPVIEAAFAGVELGGGIGLPLRL